MSLQTAVTIIGVGATILIQLLNHASTNGMFKQFKQTTEGRLDTLENTSTNQGREISEIKGKLSIALPAAKAR